MDRDLDVEDLIPHPDDLPAFTAGGVASAKAGWLAAVDRGRLPLSYRGNTTKEQLCLEYVRNFTTQFEEASPNRPPLFLTALNEAGVPKFVCTTIRPALLPAKALYDLQSCADFVAKYVRFEPLSDPVQPPRYVLSPASTVERRAGDSFDMAVTLASLLLGAGYDAMCAAGTAPAAVTLRDTHSLRSDWEPPAPAAPAVGYKRDHTLGMGSGPAAAASGSAAAGAGSSEPAYDVPAPPSLESVFDDEVRAREEAEAVARAAKADEYASDDDDVPRGRRRDVSWVADGQRGPSSGVVPPSEEDDPLRGRRVHCWVVVRPGKRGVDELLHVEPSTGRVYTASAAPYLHADVVFSNKNLWVNMQEPPEGAMPPDGPSEGPDPGEGVPLLPDAEAVAMGLAGRQEDLDGDLGVPPLSYDPTGRVILRPAGAGSHEEEGKDADDDDADGGDDDNVDPIEAAKRRVLDILARVPTKPRALASSAAAAALLERLAKEDEAAEAKPATDGGASALDAILTEAVADAEEAGLDAPTAGEDGKEDEDGDAAAAGPAEDAVAAPIGLVSFGVEDQDSWEGVFLSPDSGVGDDAGDGGLDGGLSGIGGVGGFGSMARGDGSDTAAAAGGGAEAPAPASAAGGDDAAGGGAGTSAGDASGEAGPAGEAAPDGASKAAAAAAAAAADLELEEDGEHILDLPAPWVRPLRLPRYAVREGMGLDADDEQGQREIRSMCTETRWAPRAHPRGMVCRVVWYADEARLCEDAVHERFAGREDGLVLRLRRPADCVTEEEFAPGRSDGLRRLVEALGLHRETLFFPSARTDALVRRLEVFGKKVQEWYDGEATPDRLEYRSVTFLGPEDVVREAGMMPEDPTAVIATGDPSAADLMVTSVGPTMAATGGTFVVRKMAERYARDPAAPAHRDVAKYKFLLLSHEIEARYHTAEGRVVPNTRLFKSRRSVAMDVGEAGGEGHLDVTMLTEDTFAPIASPYERETDFRTAVKAQQRCSKTLRATHEGCSVVLMRCREAEEASPRLLEDAFAEASRRVREGVALEERDDGADTASARRVDYLAPFLVDVPDPFAMDEATAFKVRIKCEKALRQRHIDRMAIIQRRLQDEQDALQRRQREFSRTRGDGSEKAEAEFHQAMSDHMFRIGVLRSRSERQKAVMMEKLQELMATFRADTRLSKLYEGKDEGRAAASAASAAASRF